MDLCKMFKYCINRGRFVSVYASIKSDANQQAQANKRASVVKLTSDKRASRRDNMSYKVIIELEYENKPNVENVLEYIEELGTDLDYKLINNSKQQASEQKG